MVKQALGPSPHYKKMKGPIFFLSYGFVELYFMSGIEEGNWKIKLEENTAIVY